MTYDVVTYNGERELMDMRLNILNQDVDKFIVVEAKTTFSGNDKPLRFSLDERHFKKFWPKIEYYVIDEDYSEDEVRQADESPNTQGAKHWKREFLQKESIKKALIKYGVQDNDLCYIGDADEIWEPVDIAHPTKLKLRVYAYWLNNRSDEEFWGTLVAYYKDIKGVCLNHLRSSTSIRSPEYQGWHFTSMGGLKEVRRKLNDSYTTESYNTYEVQENLLKRMAESQDYLGRNFTFTSDEDDWPVYLQKNWRKYDRLIKHEAPAKNNI